MDCYRKSSRVVYRTPFGAFSRNFSKILSRKAFTDYLRSISKDSLKNPYVNSSRDSATSFRHTFSKSFRKSEVQNCFVHFSINLSNDPLINFLSVFYIGTRVLKINALGFGLLKYQGFLLQRILSKPHTEKIYFT